MLLMKIGAIAGFVTLVGCSAVGTDSLTPSPGNRVMQSGEIAANDPSQSILTAISGQGTGRVIVAPTAKDDGTFSAEITINVHDAAPNTTFLVQRAPDLVPDGVCTGTYKKNVGVTLTTDSTGAGDTHFFFERGSPFFSGVRFDVVFQVYTPDLSTILQSECMTVTVK